MAVKVVVVIVLVQQHVEVQRVVRFSAWTSTVQVPRGLLRSGWLNPKARDHASIWCGGYISAFRACELISMQHLHIL